jgi:hypothetical protein
MGLSRLAQSFCGWVLSLGLAVSGCGDDSGGSSSTGGEGGEASAQAGTDGQSGAPEPTEQGGSSAGAGVGAEAGAGGQGPLSLEERLAHLGAKVDLPELPQGPNGDDLPAAYHPLRKPFATIEPHQEIFFSGPTLLGQREGMFDDNFDGAFGKLLNPQFTPWLTAEHRTAVAADVDGDGIQEFVAVYYDIAAKKLMAKVIWGPRGGAPAIDDEPFALVDVTTPSTMWADAFQHSVVAGNVDDDPADELWVGFQNLYVFDDLDHDMAELHRESYHTPYVAVTRGDFDAKLGDTTDEFWVMYTVFPANVQHAQVFDGLEPKFGAGGRILRPILTNPEKSEIALQQGFAVAGEFDGDDPQQEIAILSGDPYRWRLMIVDDEHVNYRTFDSMIIDMTGDNVMLAAADVDGDGVDEVACDRWIFDNLEKLPHSGDRTEVADIYQQELITRIPTGFFSYQMRSGTSVAPDYGVPQRPNARQFVGYDWSNGRLVHSARNPTDGNKLAWVSLGTWTANWRAGDVVAVGNVDDDSAVVRFTGDHELLYAEPEMLVAMAPPPFFADSNQLPNTYTSFGKGTADSVERSRSIGFSVGFSFGYDNKDLLGNGSRFKVSVNNEFDWSAREKTTLSEWVTYTTGPEDSVLFTVVPFDVYYYEVISAPDAAEVGKTLSVNLPRKPQTLIARSDYFDQFVGEARKSAPLFATHVVGDPFSYSDIDERDALCRRDCFMSKEAISVGQGNGWTQIDISQAASKGTGTSYKLSVEVESEASLFGVTAGVSAGFHYGYGMEITTEETTIFTGRVGSLDSLTPETTYNFGLFAHHQAHPSSIQPVLVVDYWIE